MELALVRVTRSLERLATVRLREAQTQLFHAAIEQSPVSVVITDADANIRYVNSAFSQATGYSRDEALGQNPRLLKSGELAPEGYRSFWETLSAGQPWTGEFHNKRKDGSLFWERAHVAPVRNDIGLITHYLAVKEDITASKASAQALREATKALRATQTFALMANWAYDPQARRIVSHHGLEELVGITERGAVALEGLLERFAREDRFALHQKFEKAATEGLELSATVRSSSKPERWFTIRGQPAIDPASGARQLRGFLQDITQLEHLRQALAASGEHYRRLFHDSPSAMLLIDPKNDEIVDANMAASRLYGHALTDLIGAVASALISSPSKSKIKWGDFPLNGRQLSQQTRSDGVILEVECHVTGLDIGDRSYRLCSIIDVSEQKRWERAQQQWAVLFNNASEGMAITDSETRITQVNRAFTAITGYSETEISGKTPQLLKSGRHDADFYAAMWSSLNESGTWAGEIWNRRKNGAIYPEWLSISSIRDSAGLVVNYLAVFTDISSMKETQAQLVHLAHHDPLTGLPNRLMFMERLNHAIDLAQRANSRFAVLFLDLDNFKQVNDTLGHAEGDHLLCTVAERLQGLVRSADTVARLGGDEFIILLENIEWETGVETVARKILKSLAEPVPLGGLNTGISGSLGIALYPRDGEDSTTLLSNADSAMYEAKRSGRNAYKIRGLSA
jgi:diguanylate cyclase (GGDEF)-like protein/PAS domain S-box-containing protein